MSKQISADHLLGMVDFVKNEHLYSKRLQELEKAEAKALAASGIVNTKEKAEAMLAEAHLKLEVANKLEEQLKAQYDELKQKLYKEVDEKEKVAKESIQKRWDDLKVLHDKAFSLVDQYTAQAEKNAKDKADVVEARKNLLSLEEDIKKREAILSDKFDKLRELVK